MSVQKLEAEALKLPIGERAHLAHRLIVSLDEDEGGDPVKIERAWKEEIRRRTADLEAGTAELILAEEVFADLRSRPQE